MNTLYPIVYSHSIVPRKKAGTNAVIATCLN